MDINRRQWSMSQSQENVEREALKLPRSERAQIALHLLDSLEKEDSPVSADVIERAWIKESMRRIEAYRRGEMEAYPARRSHRRVGKINRVRPVRVLSAARRDIDHERRYYNRVQRGLDATFSRAVAKALRNLRENPEAMQVISSGIRRWQISLTALCIMLQSRKYS